MEELQKLAVEDTAGLCSSWILKQRMLDTKRLMAQPGTTFPPITQHLPYIQSRLTSSSSLDVLKRCRCLSEPELGPKTDDAAAYDDELVPGTIDQADCDEDYLFEFDIGSPVTSEDEDTMKKAIVNIVEDDFEDVAVTGLRRSCSVCSGSSNSSSCGATAEAADRDGLTTFFGSISSGLGSDRQSNHGQGLEEDLHLEGLAIEPDEWKGTCSQYLKEDTMSSTSSGGTATPILAASPAAESLIVSPDSCLDEENLLEDQNLCIECATRSVEDPSLVDNRLTSDAEDENNDTETVCDIDQEEKTSLTESDSDQSFETAMAEDDHSTIEVSANFRVSSDRLQSLLGQLEPDKQRYPLKESSPLSTSMISTSPDQEICERPKLRKCSSLRTGKTPPATPGCRKIVRFADIFGLDLSEVKVFMDEVPKVPKSAYNDLNIDPCEFQVGSPLPSRGSHFAGFHAAPTNLSPATSLVPMFNQPGSMPKFLDQVSSRRVCLENAYMDGQNIIAGIVRVLNIAFHKTVTVRWTINNWSTVTEQQAQYVQGSSLGNTDKFSFRIECGKMPVGSRLLFCLKYSCAGEHWDSNNGANYSFQVFPNSGDTNSSSGSIAIRNNRPLAQAILRRDSNQIDDSRGFMTAHGQLWGTSPSQHGDDPWLRFM